MDGLGIRIFPVVSVDFHVGSCPDSHRLNEV